MDSAEIVPSHVKGDGSFVVLDFLAVSVGKPGEAAKVHPKAQVPPFDVAGRDVVRIGHSVDFARDLFEDFAGAVPVRASAGGVLEDLDELSVVGAGPKQVFNGFQISTVPIGGELKIALNTISQFGNELVSIARAPFAGVEGYDQLGIGIQRNPQVGVSPFVGIVLVGARFLGVAECPNLIGLDALGRNGLDARIKEGLRSLASAQHQGHDSVLVDLQCAGDGADAHSLKHEGQNLGGAVHVGVVASQRLGGGVGKGGFARMAAVALDFALAVGSKLVGGIVLAADAGHGVFPLALSGEKRHTIYGSRAWVTPRFGLAPRPVDAGSGALIEGMLSRWLNGYFYRLTVLRAADCDDDAHDGFVLSRASRCLVNTGRSYLEPKLFATGQHFPRPVAALRRRGIVYDPTIGPLPILSRYFRNFFLREESLNNRRQRRQGANLAAEIKTMRSHILAKLSDSEKLVGVFSESRTSCLSNSHTAYPLISNPFLNLLKVLAVQFARQTNQLAQLIDFPIQFLPLCECAGQVGASLL